MTVEEARAYVETIFPDICPTYLFGVGTKHHGDVYSLVDHIMNEEHAGRPYPRRQKDAITKRRRESEGSDAEQLDEDMEDLQRRYDSPTRRAIRRSPGEITAW